MRTALSVCDAFVIQKAGYAHPELRPHVTEDLKQLVQNALSEAGPLARQLESFSPRSGQQDMAGRIVDAIESKTVLVAESGTGTGKTFAYAVPALLSGRRVLISTGTRHLQDQLFHRDLPLIARTLDRTVNAVLLKGRANYLCWHRMALTGDEGRFFSAEHANDFRKVQEWSGHTRSGDISELEGVSEHSAVWPGVTSSSDNCLGSQCGRYEDCFVVQARRAALAADVVVINHHLFFADRAIKEDGFGELLPGVELAVFDEAHQLPAVASVFFSKTLSSRQLLALARDTVREELTEQSGAHGLREQAAALEKASADFRLILGASGLRLSWQEVLRREGVPTARNALEQALTRLRASLEAAAARGPGLANCYRRAQELMALLAAIDGEPDPDKVLWLETSQRGFQLHQTPLSVADPFQQALAEVDCAWVFTSATLAVTNDFSGFLDQLGLSGCSTGQWASPFNYREHSALYLPKGLPLPGDSSYTRRLMDHVLPLLQASRGRAFMLFTSHRALQEACEHLRDLDLPLLVQGQAPRGELLERFQALGNAVLLGTGAFWEGVDVPGSDLVLVVIDKLPFASPGDPIVKTRIESIDRHGGSAFMEYQIPSAVISLKQGAGRLIRSESDRGMLVIGDPRLSGKSYGRLFLNSLPPMKLIRSRELATAFVESIT